MSDDLVRSGPGGPPLKRVVARLTEDEHAALTEFAQDKNLSLSRSVARLVRDLLMEQ